MADAIPSEIKALKNDREVTLRFMRQVIPAGFPTGPTESTERPGEWKMAWRQPNDAWIGDVLYEQVHREGVSP